MGNTVSRGTLDVIYILFPFVLSAGLIIMIVVCWWKCKICINKHRPGKARRPYPEDPDFGHLINIQEYAENQVGTTIVYDNSPGSSCPHPYVYFSDGRITRIVPLTPAPTYSSFQHFDHSHCPSALLCNNLPRTTRNNNMGTDNDFQNHNNHHHHIQEAVECDPHVNFQGNFESQNSKLSNEETNSFNGVVSASTSTSAATTNDNKCEESDPDVPDSNVSQNPSPILNSEIGQDTEKAVED